MYPLHQSCIRRITTRPASCLVDTLSWCRPGRKLVQQKIKGKEIVCTDERTSVTPKDKIEYLAENCECVETNESDNTDDNITLWDLRKNLETNTVVFLSDSDGANISGNEVLPQASHESRAGGNVLSGKTEFQDLPASDPTQNCSATQKVENKRKPKSLKNLKDNCRWYFTTEDGSLSDLSMEDNSQLAGSKTEIRQQPDAELQPVRHVGQQQQNLDIGTRSSDSSSSSVTPDSISSDSMHRRSPYQLMEDNVTSNETRETNDARLATNLSTFTRLFRRPIAKRQLTASSYYGYSLERDYCVDPTTDRLFKEFLTPSSIKGGVNAMCSTSSRHKTAQLRRQLMRKQYSDSAAVYYGQRMRRWRMKKQRSDSVNCPVDRGVLRRQEQIHEEYFPDEIEKD